MHDIDDKVCFIEDAGGCYSLCIHKTQCSKCNKKILVQLPLFGPPHHGDVFVTCGECLKIDKGFKEKYPEIAKNIEEWHNNIS